MTILHYKFVTAIRYQLQITPTFYVLMMTSDVILFGSMTNLLMMPTFTE